MTDQHSSSAFTNGMGTSPYGPPLIGALLRMSLEVVRQRMLERLHDRGFDDLVAAHLTVLQYPARNAQPSDLAARLRMSKQALNYLLRRARAPRLHRAASRPRRHAVTSNLHDEAR